MRCRWVLVGLVGLVGITTLLGYGQRAAILRWMGDWLVAHSRLEPPWDAIVVFSGRPYERALAAAAAYQRYPALIVALGGAHNEDLVAIGAPLSQECAFTQAALRALCVPDSAILLACEGTSTVEEFVHLAQLCRARRWRRLLLVSSVFHGRRLEELARRHLSPLGVLWGVQPASALRFRPDRWWESEAGLLTVWEEYAKVWYYRLAGYF